MDAIMLALVAVLLANADGRSGIALSRLVSARRDRRVTVGVAFGAFIANAVVAAIAGAVANRMIGPGVAALLVTLAMLSAAEMVRANVCTPDTNRGLVCPMPLEKTKK